MARPKMMRVLAFVVGLLMSTAIVCAQQVATAGSAWADGATGPAGTYVPVNGPIATITTTANTWQAIHVGGVAGVPTTGVGAVAVTISQAPSWNPSAVGSVSLAPDTSTHPGFIALTYNPGAVYIGGTMSNTAIVAVGSNGSIAVQSTTNAVLVFSLSGYYTSGTSNAPGGYVPVTPTTLQTIGGVAGDSWSGISAGVPSGATAAVINFTVTAAPRPGFAVTLTPYPTGGTQPSTPVVARVGAPSTLTEIVDINDQNGQFNLATSTTYPGSNPNQMMVSMTVVGYFNPAAPDGAFTPTNAVLYDSQTQSIPASASGTLQVAGMAGIPAAGNGVIAVALNILVQSTGAGKIYVGSDDQPLPTQPSFSYALPNSTASSPGMSSNFGIYPVGIDGGIEIKNTSTAPIRLVVEVEGWYTGTRLAVTTDSSGWIYYQDVLGYSLNLINPSLVSETGTHNSDGSCSFSDQGTGSVGTPETYSEVAKFNPSICQRALLTGQLSPEASAELATKASATNPDSTSGPVQASLQNGSQPNTTAASTPNTSGEPCYQYPDYVSPCQAYEKISYIDPLFITITSLSANISWYTTQGFIFSNWISGYTYSYAFAYDGWNPQVIQNNVLQQDDNNPHYVYYDPNETFKNTDFEQLLEAAGVSVGGIFGGLGVYAACGGTNSAATFYLEPIIEGFPDLTYNWHHFSKVSGGCSGLVHFSESHGYGNQD